MSWTLRYLLNCGIATVLYRRIPHSCALLLGEIEVCILKTRSGPIPGTRRPLRFGTATAPPFVTGLGTLFPLGTPTRRPPTAPLPPRRRRYRRVLGRLRRTPQPRLRLFNPRPKSCVLRPQSPVRILQVQKQVDQLLRRETAQLGSGHTSSLHYSCPVVYPAFLGI